MTRNAVAVAKLCIAPSTLSPRNNPVRTRLPISLALAAFALVILSASRHADAHYNAIYNNTFNYEYAPTRIAALDNCDDCSTVLTLPFDFKYYGAKYNQITVSTNGVVVVGAWPHFISWNNQPLGWQGTNMAPEKLIAPLWDDWRTTNGGSIWAGAVGDHYVVEWYYVAPVGGNEMYTFELKIFPNGRIEFHYMQVVPGNSLHDRGASATIGYQQAIGGVGVGHPVSFNWPIAVDNSWSYAFIRPSGNVFFMNANDFMSPPRPRAGQVFYVRLVCGGNTVLFTWSSPSNTGGVARSTPGACSPPYTNPQMYWGWADDGIPVSSTQTQILYASEHLPEDNGAYWYFRQNGFTPAPSLRADFGTTGAVDYWQGGAVFDKMILIVPGFDPLDTDTTARYLALMYRIAPQLLSEGYDIAIGNYAQPWQSLDGLTGQVQNWITHVHGRSWSPFVDSRIQVAGVSQGGVLVRKALTESQTAQYVRAWYSVDSPQKGANLGNAAFGLYSMIFCGKDPDSPQFRTLDSLPAKQLAKQYTNFYDCDCGSIWPENNTCTRRTQHHDTFFGQLGWPTTKGHALAFGDATSFAKTGSGPLFKFTYAGTCSDSLRYGTSSDCNAGSLHVTPGDVYTTRIVPFPCFNATLEMLFWPAFINVDSALASGANLSGASDPNFDPSCAGNYTGTFDNPYWGGRTWKNTVNGKHSVLPDAGADQLINWVRQN